MECPKCKLDLYQTHSLSAGIDASVQRFVCRKCHTVFTSIRIVVAEQPEYGQGYVGVQKRLVSKVEAIRTGFWQILGQKHPKNGQNTALSAGKSVD